MKKWTGSWQVMPLKQLRPLNTAALLEWEENSVVVRAHAQTAQAATRRLCNHRQDNHLLILSLPPYKTGVRSPLPYGIGGELDASL